MGWWPAEGEDPALWHVQHTDGDEEDLEEHEVVECLVPLSLGRSDSASSQLDGQAAVEAKMDEAADGVKSADADDMDVEIVESKHEEADNTDYEPEIVTSFPLFKRGYALVRDTGIGLPGLQQEILAAHKRLAESLKRSKSDAAKTSRRAWEESVKNAVCLTDLKSALAELEEMVHQLQVEDDVVDEDEYKRNHDEKVAEMLEEGWKFECTAAMNGADENALFDPNAPQDIIGRRGRRFFAGHGKSDGIVLAYLPPEKNEGMPLWHMEHDDGDAEDIDESDVEKAIRHMASDALEDDADSELGEDEDGFEEEIAGEDDMDGDSEPEPENKKRKSEFSAHLWPTVGVRRKWSTSLHLSKTVGEGKNILSIMLH